MKTGTKQQQKQITGLVAILLVALLIIVFLFIKDDESPSPSSKFTSSPVEDTDDFSPIKKTSSSSSSSTEVKSLTTLTNHEEDIDHQHFYNIIFSCFYFRSDFYTGRTVPSLDWIIVMIEGAFEHRICNSCKIKETKLVMFVDRVTKEGLEKTIAKRASFQNPRPDFISQGFLRLVLIDEKNDQEVKQLFSSEKWADSTQLKNAANNFRFWFMWRYLTGLSRKRVGNDEMPLAEIKIAIVDATDVLFQGNPFETGVCFPSNSNNREQEKNAKNYFLFTLEDASKNFQNERYNKRWMQCYDGAISEQKKEEENDQPAESSSSPLSEMGKMRMRISCAGVSLGTFHGVMTYLSAQLEQIAKPKLASCAIETIKAALDQATHNYLMFRGAWKKTKNNFNSQNPWRKALARSVSSITVAAVPDFRHRRPRLMKHWTGTHTFSNEATTTMKPADEIAWDDEHDDCVFHGNFGKLEMSNSNGKDVVVVMGTGKSKKYAIVHQYTSNRHPKVMAAAKKRYDV